MPVLVKIDPFSRQRVIPTDLSLRTPQARLLAALYPEYPDDPVTEWPVVNRAQLAVRAGYTAISGTVTRALDGLQARRVVGARPTSGKWQLVGTDPDVWEGSSSGDPHPGLLVRGMVEVLVLDIVGVSEVNYRATALGVRAYRAYVEAHGALPVVKDAAACVNDRYRSRPGS